MTHQETLQKAADILYKGMSLGAATFVILFFINMAILLECDTRHIPLISIDMVIYQFLISIAVTVAYIMWRWRHGDFPTGPGHRRLIKIPLGGLLF